MKKSKTNVPLLIILTLVYLAIWLLQFIRTAKPNEDIIAIQKGIDDLINNTDFPRQLIPELKATTGPLESFVRVDNTGMSGIISQFSALLTVLLVILCRKPGYIISTVLNVIGSIYTLGFAVIYRGNIGALPGVAIPLMGVLTNTIIFFYLQKNRKMHNELNESYEQAIENNRIIQEKDEVLSYLAYYDRLTQMPNRHLFMENLEERVNNNEEYIIIYADIDNFRHINDTFGHGVGDELLVKFAQRIEGVCGEEIFSAKIGGDEYGFILPAGYTQNDVVQFVAKLQGVFGESIEVKGEHFSLTASFGAATFPGDARSSEDLFRCAETAMFAAKTNGKNQLCFYMRNQY
ncbi:MAG: GGDEF domain-containing protein [Ruminococcus sp.]|nr:GGDEF domain-containing protein [Ruminococcus sp.]